VGENRGGPGEMSEAGTEAGRRISLFFPLHLPLPSTGSGVPETRRGRSITIRCVVGVRRWHLQHYGSDQSAILFDGLIAPAM